MPMCVSLPMRRRWLLGLLVLQSTSSMVLDLYQDLLRNHLVVTLFLTMLVGAGGNAGNQSAIKVIRGLVGTLVDGVLLITLLAAPMAPRAHQLMGYMAWEYCHQCLVAHVHGTGHRQHTDEQRFHQENAVTAVPCGAAPGRRPLGCLLVPLSHLSALLKA